MKFFLYSVVCLSVCLSICLSVCLFVKVILATALEFESLAWWKVNNVETLEIYPNNTSIIDIIDVLRHCWNMDYFYDTGTNKYSYCDTCIVYVVSGLHTLLNSVTIIPDLRFFQKSVTKFFAKCLTHYRTL